MTLAEIPGNNRRGPTAAPGRRPGSAVTRTAAPVEGDGGVPRAPGAGPGPRKTVRPSPPSAGPSIPTSYIYGGFAAILLIIVMAVGYGPFMRYRYTSAIDGASTITERTRAADALYARRDGSAYVVFQTRLSSPDALAREASAHGMALFARDGGSQGTSAIEDLAAATPKLDGSGKKTFAGVLGEVAKDDFGGQQQSQNSGCERSEFGDDFEGADSGDEEPGRGVCARRWLRTLKTVPAPGVCAALVEVATSDADAKIKASACNGIAATAAPDAVGALLIAMTSSDAELKREAAMAFSKVREKAKSADLLPLVSSPDESVRKEIVAALGKRSADSKAAEGITLALKDASPAIRKLAAKSVPVTGISGPSSQLAALVSDADAGVRGQAAETLGELRDEGSKKALIEAFGSNPDAETMKVLSKSLGKRSNGKEIPVIALVMEQLNKRPESFDGLREALVTLTNAGQGPKRDEERKKWTAVQWNAWWDNISKREKIKNDAVAMLEKADSRKSEMKAYKELSKMTNDGMTMLETCIKMSETDDREDVAELEGILNKFGKNKYQFEKFQTLDESRGK